MCNLWRQQHKWNQFVGAYRQMSSYPISLSYEKFDGQTGTECQVSPVIILHGLFGQKTNWQTIASNLCRHLKAVIFTLDLRNHGHSPWHPIMNYAEMANDVRYFIDKIVRQKTENFSKVHLLGHSMGGKTAMCVALMKDSVMRLKSLIVEDIAPKAYNSSETFSKFIDAMKSVDLTGNRAKIEQQLEVTISDKTIRSFLLTNLVQTDQNTYRWKLNLDSIRGHIREICESTGIDNNGSYKGRCLFVSGGVSEYVTASDHPQILKQFPNTEFSVIPNAAHWIHAEKPNEFTNIIVKFILSVEESEREVQR